MWPAQIPLPQKSSAPLDCQQPRVKHNLAESAESEAYLGRECGKAGAVHIKGNGTLDDVGSYP